MTLCPNCKLPGIHLSGDFCAGASAEAVHSLLRHVGDQGTCSGCSAEIYWVRHKNGKATPYDVSGLNHFLSCPKAAQFRKKTA